jgi:hypothetical protein
VEELPDYLIPHSSGVRLTIECAMRADIFEKLGQPAFCYPFREGYMWTRYRGESYSPLGSMDQPELDGLRKALFPEHA